MKIVNIGAINSLMFFASKNKKFNPYYDGSKIAHGVNYEILDSFELKREQIISEMKEANKKGKDISADREKLIYSRVNIALKDAEEFIKKYPHFNYDDIAQELVALVVKHTDKELASNSKSSVFSPDYASARDEYFRKLLLFQKEEQDILTEYSSEIISSDEPLKRKETSIVINDAINSSLNKREKMIIYMRFGFLDGYPATYEKTGRLFNISVNRTREIEHKAIRKLLRIDKSKGLEFEDFNR